MSRFVNPVPTYEANDKLYFFDTASNTPKVTFADSDETTANTHPVIIDAQGNTPNIFFSGLAKAILTDENDVQKWNRDPISQEIAIAAFDTYADGSTYQIHSIVTTSNGQFWKSLISGNTGFNPVTDDGTHWQQIDFNEFYAAGVTFAKDDKAISTVDGLTYISGIDANKGNEPSANLDKWALDRPALPYVSGKTYSTGETAISIVDKREYESQLSQSDNEPSVDDGTNWLPTDGRVEKPVNTTPADSATGVSRLPTLISSTYVIDGSSAEHEWSRRRVYADAGRATVLYDSGISTDLTSELITTQLPAATEVFWDVEYKGIRTDISDLSTLTSFTTTLNLSESFDNLTFTGTGATQSIIATPDLSSNTGAVFLVNTSTTDNMRIVDTARGVGAAFLIPSIIETAEATGLTAFNFNGYDVGAAAAYNGSGNNIWSVVFKKTAKFFDMVSYSGDGANRVISHALGTDVGLLLICQETGAAPSISANFCWIRGVSGFIYARFGDGTTITSDENVWNSTAPTTTQFSLGIHTSVNGTARDYTAYLLSHNPAAGTYCAAFTATGTATDKIVTGFPGATVFLKRQTGTFDWIIFDKKLGTSSQIDFDSNAQLVAGANISSFDSDGVTLSNLGADTWSIVVFADPDL